MMTDKKVEFLKYTSEEMHSEIYKYGYVDLPYQLDKSRRAYLILLKKHQGILNG